MLERDRTGWRAALIGVSRYTDLPGIPAATNNVADLAKLLTSSSGGAIAANNCTVVRNPSDVAQLGAAVSTAARQAHDVLIVYYSGHGVVDHRGQLYLTLTGSNRDGITWNGVPFDTLRRELLASPAHARILILDCCFSGRAFEAMSDASSLIEGQVDIYGTYTITSSDRNEPSEAPVGHRHTAFTAALLEAAEDTSRTLDQLYTTLEQILARRGYPKPHRRSVESAGSLRLFASSFLPSTNPVPAVADSGPHSDLRSELDWWYRAAEAGDTNAMYNLAIAFDETRNFSRAITWYRRAAEGGHTDAMHNLAIRLRYANETIEATTWWQRAGHQRPQGFTEKLRGPTLPGNDER